MELSIKRIIKVGGVALLLFLGACAKQVVKEEPLPPLDPVSEPGANPVVVQPMPGGATPSAHIVQKSEGLYGIARQYGLNWKDLAAWNGINPPYSLSIGQRISLVPPGGATPMPQPVMGTPSVGAGQSMLHTVSRGEGLYGIARQYGVNWRDLAARNNIPPPYTLSVGQQLVVSSSGGAAMPVPGAGTAFQPAPVPTPETGPVYHTVNRGDTLYGVGRMYNQRPQDIAAWNGIGMNTPLVIGQSLLVTSPGANGFAQPAPVFNANPVGQGYHTVQRGDTLYSISRRFGVTVSDLARLNNLRKPYLLKVGQVLRVASSNVTISSVASPAGAIPYQVKSGDTMYSIASMFGTTREQLGAWNGIPSPYTVQPGQWLNIYRAR